MEARDFSRVRLHMIITDLVNWHRVLSALQGAGKFNEFVLRLNPFFVNLERVCWEKQSRKKGQHYRFADLFDRSGKLSSHQLETLDPDLYRYVTNRIGILKDGYLSLYVLFYIMEYYHLPENWKALFQAVFDLNEKRNHVAHRLVSTTDEEIRQFSGWNARGIVMKTAEVLGELFAPEYRAELGGDPRKSYFSLYENCNNLLRE